MKPNTIANEKILFRAPIHQKVEVAAPGSLPYSEHDWCSSVAATFQGVIDLDSQPQNVKESLEIKRYRDEISLDLVCGEPCISNYANLRESYRAEKISQVLEGAAPSPAVVTAYQSFNINVDDENNLNWETQGYLGDRDRRTLTTLKDEIVKDKGLDKDSHWCIHFNDKNADEFLIVKS